MDSIGARIKHFREEKGWTQERLAQEADVSKSFISEVENNRRNPSAEKLLDIATVLGASLDFIMTGKTEGLAERSAPSTVTIPRELAAAAEERSWPYRHVIAVLDAWGSLVARRNAEGRPQMTKRAWIEFYEKVRTHLE
jgi:transcriptional regulator with XRE-family HTH domain